MLAGMVNVLLFQYFYWEQTFQRFKEVKYTFVRKEAFSCNYRVQTGSCVRSYFCSSIRNINESKLVPQFFIKKESKTGLRKEGKALGRANR